VRPQLSICVVVLVLGLGGCVWRGYNPTPPPQTLWRASPVDGGSPLSAYFYQPDADDAKAIQGAVDTVFAIFRDPAFQREVLGFHEWMVSAESCTADAASPIIVDGDVVVEQVLERNYSGVHYLVNWFPSAIATTSPGGSHYGTSIRKYQVEKWSDSELVKKAELVDTIAHEITHLIPKSNSAAEAGISRFQDAGHDGCTERYLVSYRLGDLTGCFFRAKSEPSLSLSQCLEDARPVKDAAACREEVSQMAASCCGTVR